MSEPLMVIDVDTRELFAAMDAIPDVIMAALKGNAKVTAENIKREQQARIRRATGATGEAITIEETHTGDGYIIYGGKRQHIARFLAFGTKYMSGDDFFFTAARLEEPGHDRRALEAVQDAIDSHGLGDT